MDRSANKYQILFRQLSKNGAVAELKTTIKNGIWLRAYSSGIGLKQFLDLPR
jgi:hypothetical protein